MIETLFLKWKWLYIFKKSSNKFIQLFITIEKKNCTKILKQCRLGLRNFRDRGVFEEEKKFQQPCKSDEAHFRERFF